MAEPSVRQTASASGGGTVFQAARDIIIYGTGRTPEQFQDDPVGECPYPGLSSFGPDQAKWFFGREPAVAELLLRLDRARTEDGGPVLVVGASGAGKSSLLRCGLIHAVTTNGYGEAGSRDWPCRVFTPTATPVRALAGELAPLVGVDPDELATAWTADPAGCVPMLRDALGRDGWEKALGAERVLVVVDQFEEVFTAVDDVAERARFLALLDGLSAGPDAPAMVVIGLRADFYGHCLADPWLSAALRDPVQLGPLTRTELERVVLGPAEQVGLTVHADLLQTLLADMGVGAVPGEDTSGRLPLLAHALRATWLKRSGTGLTLAGYRDTGGIRGAVATTADRTFHRLSAPAQRAARSVFLRLVRIGSDTEDTRRHVPHDELMRGLPDPASATEVIVAYTTRRLVTTERAGVTVTHEALLSAWGTLRAWLDADRAGHVVRQELETDVRAWQAGARGLLDDVALRNAEAWAQEHRDDVTTPVAELLAASRRAADRRRRTRRIAVAVVLVLALIASAAAGYATLQQRQAVAQRNTAVARLVATESTNLLDSQPGLAKQLAAVAYRLDGASGQGALFAALSAPGVFDSQDAVVDIAETRDARTMALSTGTGIALWRTAGHAEARIGGLSDAGSVALSPDGRVLAAATGTSRNGSVRLWSLADPARPRPLASLPVGAAGVTAVAISADGHLLAAGTAAGPIALWRIDDPSGPRRLPSLAGHPGGVDSLAFAPAGPMLASSGADHLVRLWNLAGTPGQLAAVDGYHGGDDDAGGGTKTYTTVHHRVAFSPDGTILAAPGDAKNAILRFWDLRSPAVPRLLAAPNNVDNNAGCAATMRSIAFSPQGGFVATVCSGGATLWQAPSIAKPDAAISVFDLPDAHEAIGPAIFATQGLFLLHATQSGVRDWNVTDPYQPGAAYTLDKLPDGFGVAMAVNSGSRRLFAVVGGDSGELWDLTSAIHKVTDLPGGDIGASAVAFSPDGSILADSENTDNHTHLVLRLRDTTAPDVPILSTLDSEIDNGVHGLAFSPDGQTLVVADNNDDQNSVAKPPTVKLFDVHNPVRPRLIATLPGNVFAVALSPDGRLLTANTADTLLSWDITDPHRPVQLPPYQLTRGASVSGSAFSPNGQLLAVGDSTGAIRIWRVAADRLVGGPSFVRSVGFGGDSLTFSPNNHTLALNTGTGNPHVELWDLSTPAVPVLQATFAGQQVGGGGGPIVFSPNGRVLVTGVDQKIDLWPANPEDNVTTLCQSAGDVITPGQWNRYVPNEPYSPPCGS